MSDHARLSVVVVLATCLGVCTSGHGAAQDCIKDSPAGKQVKKKLLQGALRTIGKQTLRKALILKEVYDVTYSATRAVINCPEYFDAAKNLIEGVTKDQCWAIAGTEIECRGLELDSDRGQNVADADISHSCWLHGSRAAAGTRVVRGTGNPATDFISVVGHAKTSWGSADWVGLGGVGDNLRIDSSVLDMLARIEGLLLDPVYRPNESWLDSESALTPQEQAEDLIDLFRPSGFAVAPRVFYPAEVAGDSETLYYEAQIIGMLSVIDVDSEDPAQCFGVDLIMDGVYYDTDGNVTATVCCQVCNLEPSLFTYSDGEMELEWQGGTTIVQPYFGFSLQDFDLHMPVDIPDDWGDALTHVDLEVMAGSSAVPEPASALLLLLGFAGAALRRDTK